MAKSSPEGIFDARTLGAGKMLTLGVQHMFAMFGATVLVPVLTGLSMSATLLFAGLGTLLFHLLTKMRVPAFLGSSFAFLGGYAAVVSMGQAQGAIRVFAENLRQLLLSAPLGQKRVMGIDPGFRTGCKVV